MPGVREWCGCLTALWLTASPTGAQTSPLVTRDQHRSVAEVGVGVFVEGPADVNQPPACQELALPCMTPRTAPDFGAATSAALFLDDIVGILGEASIARNAWWSWGTDCASAGGGRPATCPASQMNHIRSALGGVRVRTPLIASGTTHWRFFGQLLGGPQWIDVGPHRRVLQPGVGADDYLRNGLAVHVEYDYCFSPDRRRDLSTGRYSLGIVLPLGSR